MKAGRMPLILVIGATLFTGAATDVWACSRQKTCPDTLNSNYHAPPFSFSYHSDISFDAGRRTGLICHCLSNATADPLFINWDVPGIRGFARRGAPFSVRIDISNGDFEKRPARLWYGPRPEQLETQVYVPKAEISPRRASTESQLSIPSEYLIAKEWRPFDDGSANIERLESRVRRDGSEWFRLITISTTAETRPTATEGHFSTFSISLSGPQDFSFRRTSEDRLPHDLIYYGLADPELHARTFGNKLPKTLPHSWMPQTPAMAVQGVLSNHEARTRSDSEMSLQETRLLIYARDAETVIASAPVTFFR